MIDFSLLDSLLVDSGAIANGSFGTSVAVSGDSTVMAVGVFNWATQSPHDYRGGVYIFDRSGDSWVQRGGLLVDATAADQGFFGKAVSLNSNGTVLAVGKEHWTGASPANSGGVDVYDWSGSAWVKRGSTIVDAAGVSYGDYGRAVALSANALVLSVGTQAWSGAPQGFGAVLIYDWSGSAWVKRSTTLVDSDAVDNGGFGKSVSLNSDGSIMAVGAWVWAGEALTAPGGVYVYDWSGTTWVKRGSVLKDPSAKSLGNFGEGVSLNGSGTTLAISSRDWTGASLTRQGSVLIYDWSGSAWVSRQARITDPAALADGEFGKGICLDTAGGKLVIGIVDWAGSPLNNQGAVYTYEASLRPGQRNIPLSGLTPGFSQYFDTALQGAVSITGEAPTLLQDFISTALLRTVSITGGLPTVAEMVDLTAGQLTMSLTGITPPDIINVAGRGFHAELNPTVFSIVGRGFSVSPQIVYSVDHPTVISGRGFAAIPKLFGGAVVTGQGFSASLESLSDSTGEFSVLGRGFTSSLDFSFTPTSFIRVSGRGLFSKPSMFGGGVVVGRGFSASLSSEAVSTDGLANIKGRGFLASLDSYAAAPTTITVTGRGFASSLYRFEISGRGFAVTPAIQFASASVNSEAFVLNILTGQVSRYTNYPFMHIAAIGGKYYGVKENGLYLLDGSLDVDEEVNGTIVTKDTDFGIFQSKNVPFIYLNGDDDYLVTPIVDGIEQAGRNSDFSGRKVKLGRGSKGRYWTFKIEGIKHLQGMEYLPDLLQRRVK